MSVTFDTASYCLGEDVAVGKVEGLEGETYSEVEGEVALEVGMDDGEMLTLGGVGGVDGFHAAVETEDEIVKVEADAQAIGHCDLAIEIVDAEDAVGLVGIVANVPYVARIYEESACKLPEKARAVFHAQVKADVSRLVDEVDAAVRALVTAWA